MFDANLNTCKSVLQPIVIEIDLDLQSLGLTIDDSSSNNNNNRNMLEILKSK